MLSAQKIGVALKITAFVNIGTSVAALAAPELNASILFGEGTELATLALRYHYLFWLSVFGMGVGYWIAAADPQHQTGILAAAGIGKLAVACVFAEMLFTGRGTLALLSPIAFDGLFGALFLVFAVPLLIKREV